MVVSIRYVLTFEIGTECLERRSVLNLRDRLRRINVHEIGGRISNFVHNLYDNIIKFIVMDIFVV